MPETKTMIRFFTIADYEEEEIWLHEQHKNGWKLHKMIPPCLYILESVPYMVPALMTSAPPVISRTFWLMP